MKYCLAFLAALLIHEPPLLPAQSPASDQQSAAEALHRQISQIGKDCPDAMTTSAINGCMAAVEQQTAKDFATFYGNLRSLLRTDSEDLGLLDASQQQWEIYRQKACDAIVSFYRGGTIRASAAMSCRIALTRSRMQDLDGLYFNTLHN